MSKKLVFIILFAITVFGAILRFYQLGIIPRSLNVDEISIGYNAYSILKTGKDEYGVFMPLTFESLGDYKPPLYIYLTSLSELFFGLNEFGVRFPSALLGTLTIPLIYFLVKKITSKDNYSLIGAFLLAISPWHIYFSRLASEALVATFLLMAAVLAYMKIKESKKYFWPILSAILFSASVYTYHAERIFVPIFVFILLYFSRKDLKEYKKQFMSFLIIAAIFSLPFFYTIVFGAGATRAKMTMIFNDVEFIRNVYVALKFVPQGVISILSSELSLIFFHWIRKYLAYFQPSFLFYNGLGMTMSGSYSLGINYLFELPFILFGIFSMIKNKFKYLPIIIAWILVGILPASITLNEQHPIRVMLIIPMIILISAYGAVELYKKLNSVLKKTTLIFLTCIFSAFILFELSTAFLMFSVHNPLEKGEGYMEGTKESVLYALKNKDKYKEIVFDPVRGIIGPNLVNVPHAYILFYSKYDPATYQSLAKKEGENIFGFDKFTVRPIDWRTDRVNYGVLFIGSQWSLPSKDIKSEEVLKKFYMNNGQLVLYAVTPK